MKNYAASEVEEAQFLLYYIETDTELILKYADESNVTIPNTLHNKETLENKLREQIAITITEREWTHPHAIAFLRTLKYLDLSIFVTALGYMLYNHPKYFDTVVHRFWSISAMIFLGTCSLVFASIIEEKNSEYKELLDDFLKNKLFYQYETLLKKENSNLTYNSLEKISFKELKKELKKMKKEKSSSFQRINTLHPKG